MRLTLRLMCINWRQYSGMWRQAVIRAESLQKMTGQDRQSFSLYYNDPFSMIGGDGHRMERSF